MNPSFGVLGLDFIVAHQSAMAHEPAKGPFDDPAFGQHFEAALVFEPWHHFQPQRAGFAVFSHPRGEGRSSIGLVGPQTTQPAKPLQGLAQKAARAGFLGEIGRRDAQPQQQTQGVDQDVALASIGLLARIVASDSGVLGPNGPSGCPESRRWVALAVPPPAARTCAGYHE